MDDNVAADPVSGTFAVSRIGTFAMMSGFREGWCKVSCKPSHLIRACGLVTNALGNVLFAIMRRLEETNSEWSQAVS